MLSQSLWCRREQKGSPTGKVEGEKKEGSFYKGGDFTGFTVKRRAD